jgi:hypothetical protein
MKKRFGVVALTIVSLFPIFRTAAWCGGVSAMGTVDDGTGLGVRGVRIQATDTSGNVVGSATTDAAGKYQIPGLMAGNTYDFQLVPGATGYEGGTATSPVFASGLPMDWEVSHDSEAVALADPPGTIFGADKATVATDVAGGIVVDAAGVLIGCWAAGWFCSGSGGGTQAIASPSF